MENYPLSVTTINKSQ